MSETKVVVVKITGSENKITPMSCKVRQDGILTKGPNFPIFVGDDFTEAGIPLPKINQKWDDYSEQEQALALTIDHPRVEWKEQPEIRAWLNGEVIEEDTRERQNDFLKSKGYRWSKRGVYNSGEGDMEDRWFLLDPSGNAVVGYKDGGFDLIPFGSVKEILIELGYYGQSAINEKQQADEARANRRAMRSAIEHYFENTESETPESFESDAPILRIESHMPRRQFCILDDAIVLEVHNTSDGDNWSLNNCDYGVASVFPYESKIADCLRQLAVKSTDQPTSVTE